MHLIMRSKKRKNKIKERVLVTGGAGFIGGHLVDALIEKGYSVRVLDILHPVTHNGKLPEWFNKKAEFIKGDVRNKKDWQKALKGISYVFHVAGYMDYRPDFSTYIDTNTKSTALLYEVALEDKIPLKKVIVTSSQSVYGEGKYRCPIHGEQYAKPRDDMRLAKKDWNVYCPCGKAMEAIAEKEDDQLIPINPYGISKRALEDVALTLGKEYRIPSVALRYAIVHGARQSFRNFYSGALRTFTVQALSGEDISIHEDGMQVRDFVHITDCIDAHLTLMHDPHADYQVFNIGSGRKDTVYDLAKTVAEVIGQPFAPKMTGVYRAETARNSPMDVSKLKKHGWTPRRALRDNVLDYVAWIKQHPEAKKYLHAIMKELKRAKK
jgi:dTDP-L-rhamnose 4-epimerase